MSWSRPGPGWSCAECGFSFDATDPTAVAERIAKTGKRIQAPLTRGLKDEDLLAVLRTRPEPDHWSALEYACHIRDVLQVHTERTQRLETEDRPEYVLFDVDGVVTEHDYNGQDPSAVAAEVDELATTFATLLEAIPDDGWDKFGTRGELEFSRAWMARNAQHEVEHHLLDIGRTLRTVRGR